ncbi:MAG: FAD-dependent oxidoreductase, partial [Anaerolineae bacterium]
GCGLPFFLGGTVPSVDALMETSYGLRRSPEFFWSQKRVRVLTRTRAEEIDREGRRVRVRHLGSGEESWLPYDRLVLATGAVPVRPPIEGLDLPGVFFLHQPADARAIQARLASGGVKEAVVVGAGPIGLEAADALVSKRARVTVLEMAPHILPGLLDPEMADLAQSLMQHPFLRLVTDAPVQRLTMENGALAAHTPAGTFPADLVLVAVGVRPNVELARAAGLALGPTGALAVDEHGRTSDPAIFAGGDCVESTHLVSGEKVYIPMGSTANKHGRVIGSNLAGLEERFPGVLGTLALQAFDVNIARTGLTEAQAARAGFQTVTAVAPSFDCSHYYPMHERITLKVVANAATGRLLGMQGVGLGEVVRRIDVAAAALSVRATLDDLAHMDLAYAPPFAEAMDAAIRVANVARNKVQGVARTVTLPELQRRVAAGEKVVLLDVRQPEEVEESPIALPGAEVVPIPLGQLRDRAGEVPRADLLVAVCAVGIRGYEAQRFLAGAGLPHAVFLEGGLTLLETAI